MQLFSLKNSRDLRTNDKFAQTNVCGSLESNSSSQLQPMNFHRISMVLAGVVAVGLIWGTNISLGVPGEWTWKRWPLADDFLWSVVLAGLVWGAWWVYVWRLSKRIEGFRPWQERLALVGMGLLSYGLISVLQNTAPPEFRSAKAAWVLYYSGSSGYFTQARYEQADTWEYLRTYPQRMSEGDVLHIGTHPPGLVLGYRALMALFEACPTLKNAILATQTEDFKTSADQIAVHGGTVRPLTSTDRALFPSPPILMQFCAAATVWPLYGLLRLSVPRGSAWLLASIWPLVPAVSIFLPKSDAAFPCWGCLLLWLWLSGIEKCSWWRAAGAGFTGWFFMMQSLAVLPVGFLAVAWTGWKLIMTRSGEASRRSILRNILAGSLGFLVPTVTFSLITACPMWTVWWWNFNNHAGFYAKYPRSYLPWLVVNPLELALATGLPLAIAALLSLYTRTRHWRSETWGSVALPALTWGLLWLSGKNMGEAARLWIFLMPWGIWITAAHPLFQENPSTTRRVWLWLVIPQSIVAIALISRVTGFHVL